MNLIESKIERQFKQICATNKVLCLKLNVIGHNGIPDRMIIGPQFIFFVEFKRPGCYPSLAQKYSHMRLRDLGRIVYCFNSIEQAELALTLHLSGCDPLYKIDDKGITTMGTLV